MSYAWLLGSELGIHATILAMGRHATSFRPSRLSHRATFPALIFTPRYLHHCVLAQRHEKFKVAKSSEKLRIMLQKVAKVVKYLWKICICTAILNLYPLPSKCDKTVIFMSYSIYVNPDLTKMSAAFDWRHSLTTAPVLSSYSTFLPLFYLAMHQWLGGATRDANYREALYNSSEICQ